MPGSNMIVRKYTEIDQNGLVNLWAESFPGATPRNDPSRMIKAKMLVDDLIFVAEENGEILGACMAGYDGHRGWLYAVAVAPDQRRRGVGQSIVRAAMSCLKELGCIKVNLQIRASNYEVQAFYGSMGFGLEERISMGASLE